MSQIAVRLSDAELFRLDEMIAAGAFHTRADAVRAGIRLLERDIKEARIAASYKAAYAQASLSADETLALEAALELSDDAFA